MTFICYINSAIYFSSLGFKFDQQDLMSMCVSQASQTIYLMVMLDNFIAPFSMTLLLSCFFFVSLYFQSSKCSNLEMTCLLYIILISPSLDQEAIHK